ncbi:hypothetical protein BGZ60DRAFT_430204 [Tricladium varicosporioides]|nr:hypothetical protein BGZ60DRAFT_430204 [Hymenoscyphus varicosporioides]
MATIQPIPASVLQETRGPEVIAAGVVGIVVPTIAVVLRFISRSQAGGGLSITLRFWWDDWAILTTLIFSNSFLGLNIAWTNHGLGKHFVAIPSSSAVTNNNISHASIFIYAICIWLIKVSTLLLYARIFKYSRSFALTLWVVGGVVTGWFICTAIIPWFNCYPVSKTLNLFEPGVCFNRMPWFYASAFINAIIDLLILVLPLPAISQLQMTVRRKISLVFVFILGYSSAFLSFARFIMIVRTPTLMSVEPSADATWRLIPLLIISMLEAPLAILALCSPLIGQMAARTLKHRNISSLLRGIFSTGKLTGSSKSGSSYSDVKVKSATGPGNSSTTAFADGRDSDEIFHDHSVAATQPIPMGAIGVSRSVEVTRDMERGFA